MSKVLTYATEAEALARSKAIAQAEGAATDDPVTRNAGHVTQYWFDVREKLDKSEFVMVVTDDTKLTGAEKTASKEEDDSLWKDETK